MISFLLPTRKRLPHLISTLSNTLESCSDPSKLEILLAIDDDDLASLDIISTIKKYGASYKVIISERYGYHNLHLYINALCKIATKEYLWLWNDDIEIKAKDWDKTILENISEKLHVYDFSYEGFRDPLLFPLVPKIIVDSIGHFSLNAHNDSWIYNIINHIIPIKSIPIFIYNNRTDNYMGIDYSEVDASYKISSPKFHRMTEEREKDRKRLRELVCK